MTDSKLKRLEDWAQDDIPVNRSRLCFLFFMFWVYVFQGDGPSVLHGCFVFAAWISLFGWIVAPISRKLRQRYMVRP